MGADVVVQDPGHLRVQPRHQPLGPLDDGGLQPACPEGLGELQPDVAAADDDGARGVLVELGDDPVHVGGVAQHVDSRVVGTRDRRPDRFGPQAQHELVVGLPVRPPLREVAHLDFLGAAVDADHVLPRPHIQREALAETFRRLQQQAVPVRDDPTDVIRQAAVRERDLMVNARARRSRLTRRAAEGAPPSKPRPQLLPQSPSSSRCPNLPGLANSIYSMVRVLRRCVHHPRRMRRWRLRVLPFLGQGNLRWPDGEL